jgi:FixJ family two-component response regulator
VQADEPLVVVIDDDERVCKSMGRILTASGYRARTYLRARAYLSEATDIEPACVIADIRMPEQDGIELARAMRARGIEAPLVFMTATGDVTTVVDAMKQGAVDLLAKPFSADALLSAITQAMAQGERSEHAHRDLAKLWQSVRQLTPREAEICGLVACGLANKQIAARTGITEKTVKVHRGRVMHKLGAGSLAELVRMVDRLMSEADRTVIHLDGIDQLRPSPVEIVIRAVRAYRGEPAQTSMVQ